MPRLPLALSALALSGQLLSAVPNPVRIPLVFEENQGQTDSGAKFLAHAAGFQVLVVPDGAVLTLGGKAALHMAVSGAGKGVSATGESPLPGRSNYFLGKDSSRWITGVPQFERVRLSNVQPGVDLVFYGNYGSLEYDLSVRPGVDPSKIRLRFDGADSLRLNPQGDLVIATPAGEVVQHKPSIRQGGRSIECRYVVGKSREVRVAVGLYDRNSELTIDPVLNYLTYFGGGANLAGAVADASGNIYVSGTESSITAGALTQVGTQLAAFKVSQAGYIAKLNPAGTQILYSTYIGGTGYDNIAAIAVDSAGAVYLTGVAYSNAPYPTTSGAIYTSPIGGTDAYVTKVAPSGASLVYSTLLGGTGYDYGQSIAVDSQGYAYVTGATTSSDFPNTTGAYNTSYVSVAQQALPQRVFFSKINPTGSALVYSGSFENAQLGYSLTQLSRVAVDSLGNAYVTGLSTGELPTTSGAFQTSARSGAFVLKLSADGSTPVYSTYLSGSQYRSLTGSLASFTDEINSIAVDSTGNAYVAGGAWSIDFPTTSGAFQTALAANSAPPAGFVAKLNPAGSALVYSTFLAAPDQVLGVDPQITSLAVNANGNAIVTGSTYSNNFPVTANAVDSVPNLYSSAFVSELAADGSALLFSTFIDSNAPYYYPFVQPKSYGAYTTSSSGASVSLDPSGNAYVTGTTSSSTLPVTSGAVQQIYVATQHNQPWIAKIDLQNSTSCSVSVSPASITAPAAGGSGSLTVTAPAGCAWETTVQYPLGQTNWVTLTPPIRSSSGSGAVAYSIAVNPYSSSRTATFLIGNQSVVITQPGGLCQAPSLSPGVVLVGAGAGSFQLGVTLTAGCPYTAVASAPWISVSPSTGTGSASLSITVSPNNGTSRSGFVSVNGVAGTVNQNGQGCSVSSLSPASASAGSAGTTGSITVATSTPSCGLFVYSSASWIQPASNSTGSGQVPFTVSPNPTSASRSGTIFVGGSSFPVTQSGGAQTIPNYLISTIAGAGGAATPGLGDGGAATAATISGGEVAFDSSGNLFVSDQFKLLRKIDSTGTILAYGNAAGLAQGQPYSLVVAPNGTVYFGSYQTLYSVPAGGSASMVPITGLSNPYGLAAGSDGTLYIADGAYQRVLSYNGSTVTQIVQGNVSNQPNGGFAGDGGPASTALLNNPQSIAVDSANNIYIADSGNNRVRKISGGIINTVAGNGSLTYSGDGGPATSAGMCANAVAVDPANNLLIADSCAHRVRRVTTDGTISTIAGSGSATASGDGASALFAGIATVSDLAVDPATGNIAIGGSQIRLLTPDPACSFTVTFPGGLAASPIGGMLAANVLSNPGCAWTAASSLAWLSVSPASFTGSGGVVLTATANLTGASRSGSVTIAGQSFTVTQGASTQTAIQTSLSPVSGSGSSQSFTLSFTDSSGAGAINSEVLIINSSLTAAHACAIQATPGGVFLINDADTGLLGPLNAGGGASNSQCSVQSAARTNVGNTSTITVSLAFTAAFAGQKYLYSYAADTNGAGTGYSLTGAYTVLAPPAVSAVSASPNSGSTAAYTPVSFAAVFSDTAGAGDLSRRVVIINSSLSAVGACAFEIDAAGAFLINDADSNLLGPLASGNTFSNSQCSVTGTSTTNSGNNSTFQANISFTNSFTGAKNIYLFAANGSGINSGYQSLGSLTINLGPAPTVDSVTPNSGSGTTQSFTAVFSDAVGASALTREVFIINSNLSAANACSIEYDPGAGVFLDNDGDTGVLGPIPTGGSVSNSQCSVTLTSIASINGGRSTSLTFSITFAGSFAGTKNIYMFAADSYGKYSGYQLLGTFTAVAGAPVATPHAVSVSPNSGGGGDPTFTLTFSDDAGASALNRRVFIVNSTLSAVGGCAFELDPGGMFLLNDNDSALLGPLTRYATFSNSQCSVTGASMSNSGNTSTISLTVAFSASFAGAKNLYLYADDTSGRNTGYQLLGTYTASAGSFAPNPTPVSVSPASGSGLSQTFTAVFYDASGAGSLNRRVIIINSALSAVGACALEIDPGAVYLINDADTAYVGALTSSNSLSNSQCTVNGSGTSVVNSGDTSTVTVSLNFTNGFAGMKNVYLFATDTGNAASGYLALGTFTIP